MFTNAELLTRLLILSSLWFGRNIFISLYQVDKLYTNTMLFKWQDLEKVNLMETYSSMLLTKR